MHEAILQLQLPGPFPKIPKPSFYRSFYPCSHPHISIFLQCKGSGILLVAGMKCPCLAFGRTLYACFRLGHACPNI